MSFMSLRHAEKEEFWNHWISELYKGHVGMTYKIKKVLYSGQSKFQRIDILDTYEYGKMLVLYGSVMITDRDEFVYHEMLSHVPYFTSGGAKKVLIIGGGDGLTAREFLKHPSVEQITLVDIDGEVVERCSEFFEDSRKVFANPRMKTLFQDGAEFIRTTEEKFDIIVIDASDPVPPADVLFDRNFYENCKKRLSEGGILVPQTESPFYNPDVVTDVVSMLREQFKVVMPYICWIPTYPGALWCFSYCSDSKHPIEDFDREAAQSAGMATKYYNADIHTACFALPTFVKNLIK